MPTDEPLGSLGWRNGRSPDDPDVAAIREQLIAEAGIADLEENVVYPDEPAYAERAAEVLRAGYAAGATLALIPDGDVMGALQTSMPDSTGKPPFDVYVGSGGAPEGVLAAAGLGSLGGSMFGRLIYRSEDERMRAERLGLDDLNRVFTRDDLAAPGSTLLLAGVTEHVLKRVTADWADVMVV